MNCWHDARGQEGCQVWSSQFDKNPKYPREGTPFPAAKYLKKHWSIGPA